MATVSRGGRKKPPELMMLTGGTHLSLVEDGREYPLGILAGWAVGRLRDWAEWLPRGLFLFYFIFFFFFFCFLISLILFAKMLQINSNHFQNFSKINAMI
jgi:hypothetical protein